MQRWFRAVILAVAWISISSVLYAQPPVELITGEIGPNDVRVLSKDTLYTIDGRLRVSGALVIEPGTTVEFKPNGRLVVACGGRVLADGQVFAIYNNPFDPLATPKFNNPSDFYSGYADLDYFIAPGVYTAPNIGEPTVNFNKADDLFRVNLGTAPQLQNLTVGAAMLYHLSRIDFADKDPNINQRPWRRPGGRDINVEPDRITFRGNPVNDFSRDWGHIVVMPGARAAYFRDVDFQNMRKDSTVDRFITNEPYYEAPDGVNPVPFQRLSERMTAMTQGSGGALTTMSVRTWLVNCNFEDNFARYRGGALQILEAPLDDFGAGTGPAVYEDSRSIVAGLDFYPLGTNPNVTNYATGEEIDQQIPAIDDLRNSSPEPLTDKQRQLVDDGRLAVYLCRMRRLTFRNNQVLVSKHDQLLDNGVPIGTKDILDEAADIEARPDRQFRNLAFGGAMYISGRKLMQISFGNNHDCAPESDFILFEGNIARNLQPGGSSSQGARGGAVYVGTNTSVIFAGRFINNETQLDFNSNLGDFSQGGAIYGSVNAPLINIRGGRQQLDAQVTYFEGNKSGRGGAIYQAVNPLSIANRVPSPVIGGSDFTLTTRDYGFNIKFLGNQAEVDGGAIFTSKNMLVNGAGGTVGTATNYGGRFRVEFRDNWAGLSGGAISVDIRLPLTVENRRVRIVRTQFTGNTVASVSVDDGSVKGGGAIYAHRADLYEVRATEFLNNTVYHGNGGAIAMVDVRRESNRNFVTDFDLLDSEGSIIEDTAAASQQPYTYNTSLPPDARSLTRFLGNRAIPDLDQMGSGTTQVGDVLRTHPNTNLAENGTGLGGAIYVLDQTDISRLIREDRLHFNRVRFQDNEAYSGAVVYSDNYDLEIALQRSLITGNMATSEVGMEQNAIFGPFVNGINPASSDLAGAVLYGEMVGPIPYADPHTGSNAIYDNGARFLIRLPDAPDTKGTLARGDIGAGKIDNMQGNYWGRSEANVVTIIERTNTLQETFFIEKSTTNQLSFVRSSTATLKQQGPFETNSGYNYTPIPVSDDFDRSIPEHLLMQGHVYDIFDKGTDAKSLDYANRRMARIEDFAVGVPPRLRVFDDATKPSYNKVVKRWTRDPFVADVDSRIALMQTEYVGNSHPIGYPLFLESYIDYDGDVNKSNNDNRAIHETVYFIINENTGDFVRCNLEQVNTVSEVFRGRCELIPDSSNRFFNPLDRRTAENLANFGGGAALLQNISAKFQRENSATHFNAARNEDLAALQGRRYETLPSRTGGAEFNYSNRPELDPSVQLSHYGGERFNALPVRVGDTVRVISRTVLWKDGVNTAIDRGLKFGISASTPPPVLTGFKLKAEVEQIEGYEPADGIDVIFLTEDLPYPFATDELDVHPGRDSIFAITAVDTNRFWNPNSIFNPSNSTGLEYEWEVEPNSGLSHWLQSETFYPDHPTTATLHGANGWVNLFGRPTNPYVVPGGEVVTVRARNWAPHYRTVDEMRAGGVSEEEIAKYIYLYRPYMFACDYDTGNSRFLQQDSVNFGFNNTAEYRFRLIVVDSIPVFEEETATCQKGDGDTLVASVIRSGDNFMRFRVDVNTDDEREDADAAALGWDFRYGRTAYSFEVKDIRPNPEDTATDRLFQNRPIWLSNQYLLDEADQADPFAVAFTDIGLLNVQIPWADAEQLLTPVDAVNGSMINDTSLTVVVSDGHGGINSRSYNVLINYSPEVTTNFLELAVEDDDYNPQLLDSSRAIRAFDPNFDQRLTFRLLYEADQAETILKDPCFPEAGDWNDIVSTALTPEWLLIDPVSGRLYGAPRVNDAPRLGGDAETVTVLVTDECGLTHVRQITLEIDMVNHNPTLVEYPAVDCVDEDGTYTGTFEVIDIDLQRAEPNDAIERITVEVIEPAGWTVAPSTIVGGIDTDRAEFEISGTPPPARDRNPDGTVTVRVRATDSEGEVTELVFRIAVSQATDFLSEVAITNSLGAFQILQWGTGANATTGKDANAGGEGKLDSNYCEFEIPPIPLKPIFDARWDIPNREGTVRNIVPPTSNKALTAIFQAGGAESALNYPIQICWDRSILEAAPRPGDDQDYWIRDGNTKGNRFLINMREPIPYNRRTNDVLLQIQGDSVWVRILNSNITGFEIVREPTTLVNVWEQPEGGESLLAQNTPNPFSGNTVLSYRVENAGNLMLEVYDAIGTKVTTLVDDYFVPGEYNVKWDGRNAAGQDVAEGVYTYRMSVNGQVYTRKMMLMR